MRHTWKEIRAVPLSLERGVVQLGMCLVRAGRVLGTMYVQRRRCRREMKGTVDHDGPTLSLYLSSISDRGGSVISDI